MESKRKSVQEGDERSTGSVQVRGSKRSREDESQESDIFRAIIGKRFLVELLANDLVPCLEALVGRVVKEEIERKLPSRTLNEVGTSGSRFLELVFNNKLPDRIYTYSKIPCIEIALYDTRSNSIVTAGPLSCMKVKICVLNGDFDCEDWTIDEFNKKILRQRENKGKLLKGETVITLKNGVGYIFNVEVTDNSKWIRCGHFRIGAKAWNDAINIKEGRSNKFRVLDARGRCKLINVALSLNDEICRLIHIRKNGKTIERLRSLGISTVKDLLQEHETNPSSLKKKFGNISKKHQEEIIKHAKEAKNADTSVAQATFDSQNYYSENSTLNSYDKSLKDQKAVETIIQEALASQATQYGFHDQNLLFSNIAQQEEIFGLVNPQNLSRGGQYGPGTANIDTPDSDIFDLFLHGGGDDGAGPSNSNQFEDLFPQP